MKRFECLMLCGLIGLMSGCPGGGSEESPESVLEGTWRAVFDMPGDLEGVDVHLVFDEDGMLLEINAMAEDGRMAVLNVGDATTTTVEENQVTISIPRAAGAASVFTGTLSADQNSIDGAISMEIPLESGDLTLPGREVTLTREADNVEP